MARAPGIRRAGARLCDESSDLSLRVGGIVAVPALGGPVVRHVFILDLKSPLRRDLVTNTRNHQQRHPERSEGSRLAGPALRGSYAESGCFASPRMKAKA